MKAINRRTFILQVVAGSAALAAGQIVTAEAEQPKGRLTETDAYAKSMGFKEDTTKVDQARFPRHTADQQCSKCQLFKGESTDAEAPCSFFGNRIVPATGWCRNFKARTA